MTYEWDAQRARRTFLVRTASILAYLDLRRRANGHRHCGDEVLRYLLAEGTMVEFLGSSAFLYGLFAAAIAVFLWAALFF